MSVFRLAVLGAEAEQQAAAAALGLAGGRLAPAVIVTDRVTTAPMGLPATPSARRLAGLLAHDAEGVCARGRLVLVRSARDDLARVARRVAARSHAPVALALTRPRDEVTDVLLAESLRVVVLADPGGPVAALALAALAQIGVAAEACDADTGPSVSLARLGWGGRAPSALLAPG